jgi:hypothetical protein
MIGIVVGALGLLVGLVVIIGVLLDREAREGAWLRIALARRANDEEARKCAARAGDLDARQGLLDSWEQRVALREQKCREIESQLVLKESMQRHEDGRHGASAAE